MKTYRWIKAVLVNEALPEKAEDTLSNEQLTIGEDGWALAAPYGDKVYNLTDGKGSTKQVIQRFTKKNADALVNSFSSLFGSVKRFFKGMPIYAGHPDDKILGHFYQDKAQKGIFNEMQAREDGLYVKPLFNDDGAALLNGEDKLFFSVRWAAKQTGTLDGKPVMEPFKMLSIGMTPTPNLATELLNSQNIMDRKKIVALLASLGVALSNTEADDAAIEAAVTAHNTALANTATETANKLKDAEKKAQDAEAALANARKDFTKHVLDSRIKDGAITEAERQVWEGRLVANFTNELQALQGLSAKLKTEDNKNVDGSRRPSGDMAADAASKLVSLTNERMRKDHLTWIEARDLVNAENPELVSTAFGNKKAA